MTWTKNNIAALIQRGKPHGITTATAFAELVGVKRAAVSNWVAGRRSPCPLARKQLDELARRWVR